MITSTQWIDLGQIDAEHNGRLGRVGTARTESLHDGALGVSLERFDGQRVLLPLRTTLYHAEVLCMSLNYPAPEDAVIDRHIRLGGQSFRISRLAAAYEAIGAPVRPLLVRECLLMVADCLRLAEQDLTA